MSNEARNKPRLRVLYVDDEAQSLKYFQKAFSAAFDVLTATGADDAWRIIQEHRGDLAILVTDQRMPGRTGVDLLAQARNNHPNMVRILTTAFSDLDSAIAAVNEGAIHRYVVKPWNLPEFEVILAQAAEFFLIRRERDRLLSEKLSMIQRLLLFDRVKALCILAAALSPRFQGALRAAAGYLDAFPGDECDLFAAPAGQAVGPDLQELTRRENRHMIESVRSLAETASLPAASFETGLALGPLVAQAAERALKKSPGSRPSLENRLAGSLPPIRGDRKALDRALQALIEALLSLDPSATLCIEGAADNRSGSPPGVAVRIGLRGDCPSTRLHDLFALLKRTDSPLAGAGLFQAFLVFHHHGGDLRLLGPDKPATFEFRLPCEPHPVPDSPDDADRVIARLLDRIEEWEINRL